MHLINENEISSIIKISINSILLWISILVTFVVAIIALFKKNSSSGSSSSGGEKSCTCNYDDIEKYLIGQGFVQNYTTIYPKSIGLKNSDEDVNSFFTIQGDENKVTFSGPGDGLTMSFQKEDDNQKQGVVIKGDQASMVFNSSDTAHDIINFCNLDDSKCYWYYNYNNESEKNCN